MTEFDIIYLIGFKMFFAVLCGAIVGIEREIHHAQAGFKTQILICVGSMLFTVVPSLTASPTATTDAARVIAQIISGVGFLGAGAILHGSSSQVIGLTTAAWIWFTAAIGIMIGLEHGVSATFTTITLVIVISCARKIEQRMFNKAEHFLREVKEAKEKKAS